MGQNDQSRKPWGVGTTVGMDVNMVDKEGRQSWRNKDRPVEEIDVHEHCRGCFVTQCTQTISCSVVFCPLGCGVKLHACKTADHSLICQNQKVPCTNSYYGCPVRIQRSHINSHLQNCAASIILCTMEWGRYPLYSKERLRWVPFEQPNPPLVKGNLDVELAMRDQKVVAGMRQKRFKQGLVKKSSERFDPSTKLSYKRAKKVQDEIRNAGIVAQEFPDSFYQNRSGDDTMHTELEELLDCACTSASESPEIDDVSSIPECPELVGKRSGLGLNLNIETISKFSRHTSLYRVPCGQVLKRREFAAHFKNVHNDIHGGLGWMEQRCPMAQYGCPFVGYRLRPLTQEGRVVFSENLGVFGIKPIRDSFEASNGCSLICLPSELLEEICKWLDGFSLCNLALTCKTLHSSLCYLLPRQGVVVVHWKKRVYEDGSVSWTIGNKSWSITTAFSEVHHWVHSKSPALASHFEKCPFYERYLPEKPFRYEPVWN